MNHQRYEIVNWNESQRNSKRTETLNPRSGRMDRGATDAFAELPDCAGWIDREVYSGMTLTDSRPKCNHCGLKTAKRPRGLCHRCYFTPAIRRQHRNGCWRAALIAGRTCAQCGCFMAVQGEQELIRRGNVCSTCKIECPEQRRIEHERLARLERRAAAGLPLFDGTERRDVA